MGYLRQNIVFAIKTDGTLWGCGKNSGTMTGCLGLGDAVDRSSMTQVGSDTWQAVSVGTDHVAGIKQDGTLWCWGEGSAGQLGQGAFADSTSPVQESSAATSWVAVAAGYKITLAAKSDGTLWAWGLNNNGQLGNGTTGAASNSPVQVGTATDWGSVVGANDSCIALKANGDEYAWGEEWYGEWGSGMEGYWESYSPASMTAYHLIANIDKLDHGANRSMIIAGGLLYGMGDNTDNSLTSAYSGSWLPEEIGGAAINWVGASVSGSYYSGDQFCLALKADGTIHGCGSNGSGSSYGGWIGTGDYTGLTSFTQIGVDSSWAAVVAGAWASYGIKADGTLWGWGMDYNGCLGQGSTGNNTPSPVQIGTDTDWAVLFNVPVYAPAEPEAEIKASVSPGEYYRLTLTGGGDATTDIYLPMSSLNARLRSGSPSYLQVVIPYTDDYAAAVNARQNGDLQVEHISRDHLGNETETSFAVVDLETIQVSRGEINKSIVLTGHRTVTNGAPASHSKVAASMQSGTGTTTAIIPGFDPDIAAGDDITVDGITYTIGTVSLQASPANVQTQYIEG